mmetsp:Transcript_50359/g.113192  ORF Transcript_50359/g.113192 Transcript_50359/m.113192 type:complete len:202 (-) Transcript_50359:249-854(-)
MGRHNSPERAVWHDHLGQRRAQRARRPRQPPAAEAHILLADPAGRDPEPGQVVALVAPRPENGARGRLVEPVHQAMAHARVLRYTVLAAKVARHPGAQWPPGALLVVEVQRRSRIRVLLIIINRSHGHRPARRLPQDAKARLGDEHVRFVLHLWQLSSPSPTKRRGRSIGPVLWVFQLPCQPSQCRGSNAEHAFLGLLHGN